MLAQVNIVNGPKPGEIWDHNYRNPYLITALRIEDGKIFYEGFELGYGPSRPQKNKDINVDHLFTIGCEQMKKRYEKIAKEWGLSNV